MCTNPRGITQGTQRCPLTKFSSVFVAHPSIAMSLGSIESVWLGDSYIAITHGITRGLVEGLQDPDQQQGAGTGTGTPRADGPAPPSSLSLSHPPEAGFQDKIKQTIDKMQEMKGGGGGGGGGWGRGG